MMTATIDNATYTVQEDKEWAEGELGRWIVADDNDSAYDVFRTKAEAVKGLANMVKDHEIDVLKGEIEEAIEDCGSIAKLKAVLALLS